MSIVACDAYVLLPVCIIVFPLFYRFALLAGHRASMQPGARARAHMSVRRDRRTLRSLALYGSSLRAFDL